MKKKIIDPVYFFYSLARFFYLIKLEILSIIIRIFMRIIFSCDIPYKCKIGSGTRFPHHALGIVIHPKAKIGENCHINQHVTIGGRSGIDILPIIGNNVLIGASAIIIGDVEIGDNVKIGAGAIVVKSIPKDRVVVGPYAKIIK